MDPSTDVTVYYSRSAVITILYRRRQIYAILRVCHNMSFALFALFLNFPALTYTFALTVPLTRWLIDTSTEPVRHLLHLTTIPLILPLDLWRYVHIIAQTERNPNDSCGTSLTANSNAERYFPSFSDVQSTFYVTFALTLRWNVPPDRYTLDGTPLSSTAEVITTYLLLSWLQQ